MDRGWYARIGLVGLLLVGSVLVVWPSVDAWLPAPAWLKDNVSSRIAPGLDVKGGLRLTYEVEVDEAIRDRRDRLADDMLDRLGVAFGIFKAEERPTREQLDKVRERVKSRDRRRAPDSRHVQESRRRPEAHPGADPQVR